MDKQAVEVISAAIEEQKQQEVKSKIQSSIEHENGTILPEQIDAALTNAAKHPDEQGTKSLPRSVVHKSFAVDPALNVAVGIVPDIIGPRTRNDTFNSQPNELGNTNCTRCKKEFPVESNGKMFKLCPHCRELQRERSRRWQQKTKQKSGACRRCGIQIPDDQSQYVLCPPCRLSLRTRKASRYENGKCVHCSGINDSTEFKVCSRCRDNDKQRRKALEERGCCNRCAQMLKGADKSHKVCSPCRSRKKHVVKVNAETTAGFVAQENGTNDGNIIYQQQVAQPLEANLFVNDDAQEVNQARG